MPTIEREGATLHYVERGAGPAIILQHALSADARSWDAIGVADALVEQGFRVILPDALGHGRSGPAAADRVGLSSRVADIIAIVDALAIEQFHYAGYSMGGWLGTGLMAAVPERLRSVAIGGWDPVDGARRFTALTNPSERRSEFLVKIAALVGDAGGDSAALQVRLSGFADTYARLFTDLPSIAALFENETPLALAVGERDPYLDPVVAAADALGIDPVIIPGDHVSAFLDPRHARFLTDWLREVGQ